MRLEKWRVVDRLRQRIGGVRRGSDSIVYGLGPSGQRLLARMGLHPKRLGTPGDLHVAHTLAVTELVVRLHAADIAGELDLVEIQTEPACWREFLGGLLAARKMLRPDLFVRIGVGALEDRWWIESIGPPRRGRPSLPRASGTSTTAAVGEEQSRTASSLASSGRIRPPSGRLSAWLLKAWRTRERSIASDDSFHPQRVVKAGLSFGNISRARRGRVGIVAGRGGQLRARRAVAWLSLSGRGSQPGSSLVAAFVVGGCRAKP